MADISYTRTFTHIDWIDNQDVVQAGGDKGFNQKFHGLETELDAISTTFGNVNTAIKTIQQINFLSAQPPTTLAANTASVEFPVEVYDRTNFPANVEKIYFAIIFPVSGSTKIRHIFLYRQAPQNKIGVTVQFFNDDAATQTQFAFRILTVATQS